MTSCSRRKTNPPNGRVASDVAPLRWHWAIRVAGDGRDKDELPHTCLRGRINQTLVAGQIDGLDGILSAALACGSGCDHCVDSCEGRCQR